MSVQQWHELGDKRGQLAEQIKDLADRQESWTAADEQQWTRLNAEYDTVYAAWQSEKESIAAAAKRQLDVQARLDAMQGHGSPFGSPGQPFTRSTSATANGPVFEDTKGHRLQALLPNESFAAAVNAPTRPGEELSLGRAICAALTGRWGHAEREIKAIGSTFSGPDGGVLVPASLSARIIDLARNTSSVLRAGALTLPMPAQEVTIARLASDPTSYWTGETGTITTSTATFEGITLSANKLACLVPVSNELLEDGIGVARVLENAIANSIALGWDQAALRGTPEGGAPTGIRHTTGITTTAIGGAVDYDDVLDGISAIDAANGEANGWILHPTEVKAIRKLKDGEGQYLPPPPDVASLNRFVSNQQTEGEICIGDFRQLILGVRAELRLEFFRQGTDGTNSAMSKDLTYIRAIFRGDCHLAQPSHFVYLTGIS